MNSYANFFDDAAIARLYGANAERRLDSSEFMRLLVRIKSYSDEELKSLPKSLIFVERPTYTAAYYALKAVAESTAIRRGVPLSGMLFEIRLLKSHVRKPA